MSDIRNVNIIVSTLIIGVMSVLFIICFYIYLRRRKNAIVQLQNYMDKISRGNYELEIMIIQKTNLVVLRIRYIKLWYI